MSDWYLFDVGWLFLGGWSVVVAVVSITAFAPELFHSEAVAKKPRESNPAKELSIKAAK